jgi:hypothetical protein
MKISSLDLRCNDTFCKLLTILQRIQACGTHSYHMLHTTVNISEKTNWELHLKVLYDVDKFNILSTVSNFVNTRGLSSFSSWD